MVQEAVGGTGEDMTDTHHYDLIIIGGGPAGQGAAEFAAFARRRTLVIERKVLGGLVVTTGGGPTKTLREAALHLTGFRYRGLYGLTEQPDIGMAVERYARTDRRSFFCNAELYSLCLCRQVRSRCHLWLGVFGPKSHRYSHSSGRFRNGTRLHGSRKF